MDEKVLSRIFEELSKTQVEFICEELSISVDEFEAMDLDELDQVYEKICDIEVEETLKHMEDELEWRGKMAEGIVTIIGNIYADEYGYFDEDDFDED